MSAPSMLRILRILRQISDQMDVALRVVQTVLIQRSFMVMNQCTRVLLQEGNGGKRLMALGVHRDMEDGLGNAEVANIGLFAILCYICPVRMHTRMV